MLLNEQSNIQTNNGSLNNLDFDITVADVEDIQKIQLLKLNY
jgi:hypothetical protein